MKIISRLFRNSRSLKIESEKDLWSLLGSLEGQINPDELFELYTQVSNLPEKSTIVEIGSYRGKSSIALGLAAKKTNSRVYCIDPHDEFTGVAGGVFGPKDLAVKLNVINRYHLGEIVFPICMGSEAIGKVWDKPINLLWIDGDHRYEAVKTDFVLFSPFIKKNGCIIFHDSDMEGVAKCISELDKEKYLEIKTIRSMKVFKVTD
jgi:predicted O-methyltransferase YrrM